ncbi:MAG: hypothetical protein HZC02_02090 [Candidatus Levybacteria bacterium]|nr:hypothetical protein [Candidatus Levybacteria bacterium]
MRKYFLLLFSLFSLALFFVVATQKTEAASLLNASASATTSRPSPSSPLFIPDPMSIGTSSARVYDNLSTFLSSDSAKFFNNGVFSEILTVATTSADRQTLFFTGAATAAHNRTSVITAPITAMHQFVFTTQTAIPVNGTIEITYPNSGSLDTVQASPSANTWMFNGLSTSNIKQKISQGTAGCNWTKSGDTNGSGGQTPKLVCTVTGAIIPAGATVWVWVGCSTYTNGTSCATQNPNLINPTALTGRGIADVKNINVITYDVSGGNILDSSSLKMGTIDSVFVVAHVDPTFTFRIDGVASGVDINTLCSGYTSATYFTQNQSGVNFPTTGTDVNLGTVSSGGPNYAAQKMSIVSNTSVGYVITATSSGFLVNPSSGKYIVNTQGNVTANNTPAPVVMPGTGGFGINACDSSSRVNTTTWGTTAPKFANPSQNFYYTLVNYAGALSGTDNIYVVYGAQAQATTPPGDYWEIMTYTASVAF